MSHHRRLLLLVILLFRIDQTVTAGTVGVWRVSAINDVGGWYDLTMVEDMDLAVCAGLNGWNFVYVDDIKVPLSSSSSSSSYSSSRGLMQVKSELSRTFKSYMFQQHRWSCGPLNLFKKIALEIITNHVTEFASLSSCFRHVDFLMYLWVPLQAVSMGMNLYLFFYFFLYVKVLVHLQAFCYFCTAIPLTAFALEINILRWELVYAPLVMTLLKGTETPQSAYSLLSPLAPSSTLGADPIIS